MYYEELCLKGSDLTTHNYEDELEKLFESIEAVASKVIEDCKLIYERNGLFFNDVAFRSVVGDIHAKVLGKYLKSTLEHEPEYEKTIVGRIRADIQFGETITIEVKSHGQFDSDNLKKRFERLVKEKPSMKHLYVTFREREDYVEKTIGLLRPLKVDAFFLSSYTPTPYKLQKSPQSLRRLLETIKEELK